MLTLSGSGNLVISDALGTHNDTVTLQSDAQHGQYIVTDPSQALDVSSIRAGAVAPWSDATGTLGLTTGALLA